jgi:proteasome component ECM29
MATIEDTLDNLDGPSTAELIPQLIRSIKSSLSLPSKVGCSRVVVSLVMRHPVLFKPYADEVAKVLVGAVKDRSDAVSQSYAAAVGYLSRIATDKGILSIVEWAQKTYWEGEERDRRASGLVAEAVYKQ